ncbi:MAG: hypothetical protein R6U10_01985 [Thermoplasmatota archaeon]
MVRYEKEMAFNGGELWGRKAPGPVVHRAAALGHGNRRYAGYGWPPASRSTLGRRLLDPRRLYRGLPGAV